MKTLIIIIFLAVAGFACKKEDVSNETNNNNVEKKYFTLRDSDNTVSIYYFSNNEIIQKKSFQVNENTIYSFDGKSNIVFIDVATNQIKIHDIITNEEFLPQMQHDINIKSVFIKNENILIGGQYQVEMMLQYNIELEEWFVPEIPEQFMKPGKSIDDFVLKDSIIIAVDNVVTPKFLLYYKLKQNSVLEYLYDFQLFPGGAYESFFKGVISDYYLTLLSRSFSGWSGEHFHISVYDINNMDSFFMINSKPAEKFKDVLLIGKKLLIASNQRGLGKLVIENISAETGEGIEFEPIPNIYKLTKIPKTTNYVVTTRDEGGVYEHFIK